MLYVFGFTKLSVVLADLYFADPNPEPGQEGAERGVRLEVRFVNQQDRGGSVYASQPIVVGEPVWRVDLLESVANPDSLDRAHHHPRMRNWEPGRRKFESDLTADPLGWLSARLECFSEVLEAAGVDENDVGDDIHQLRTAAPEIVEAARRLLKGVGDGDLARAPADANTSALVRAGWL